MSADKLTGRITPYHWIMFLVCFFGTAFAGTISTLMSVYLPVAVQDLLGNRTGEEFNQISAFINSIFVFGGAFGGLFAGWLSDRAGRKPAVIFSILCYSVFTILTGYMQQWEGVVACRCLAGMGFGAILVTTTTLMMEEWPEKTRAVFMGILSISIPVGIFSAGVIDYFVSSWRQAFLVGIFPTAIGLAGIAVLKESPVWKSQRKVIAGITNSTAGNRPPGFVSNLLRGSVIFGAMLIGLWAIFSWLPTWIHTLVVTGDGRAERGISMMMLGMGGLAGGFISGWIVNAVGAKRSLLACYAVCAIAALLLFKTNTVVGPVVYAEILLIAVAFGISQGVLSIYIPSLFLVSYRGLATGICFNTGRFFTAAAVLFVGVLVDKLGGYGHALFLFSLVFIAGLLVTWMAPAAVHRIDPPVKEAPAADRGQPFINLENNFPGIRGLMLYSPETAAPMNALAEVLLRDENNLLSRGDRELIGAYVSHLNDCFFCQNVHGAMAQHYLGCSTSFIDEVKTDPQSSAISPKLKSLLAIAASVQVNGGDVTPQQVEAAWAMGATDREIHDTVLIAAAFSMFNRYVDGLNTWAPPDRETYISRAALRAEEGYSGDLKK